MKKSIVCIIGLLLLVVAEFCLASSSSVSISVAPLQKIIDFFSNDVIKVLAGAGILICGAALIFGGEIGDLAKQASYVGLGSGVAIGGTSAAASLFDSGSGALIVTSLLL